MNKLPSLNLGRVLHLPRVFSCMVLPLLLLTATLLAGCSQHKAGKLEITSQSERGAALAGQFTTGLYRFDDRNQITMLLVDGDLDAPRQAVTVRMFWTPRPGRTPIDPTATNATIHYVIFAGDQRQQVGIYSGAGFLFPHDKLGEKKLSAEIWQSTLRLTDATPGFQDLLGPASLKGAITLRHDDVALERAIRKLNISVRKTIGFPRLVEAPGARRAVTACN